MQRLYVIFVLLITVSCGAPKRPDKVLSQAQLSALLVDIYLAEARVDQIPTPKDSLIKYYLPFEEKLLMKKGITDSVLKITYAYYLEHPKELEQIYDAVIDSLSLKEQRFTKALVPAPAQPLPAAKRPLKLAPK